MTETTAWIALVPVKMLVLLSMVHQNIIKRNGGGGLVWN